MTVQFSWAAPGVPPTTGNTWTEGTFTIQSLGTPGSAVFTPIYKSIATSAEDPLSYVNSAPYTTDDSVAPLVLVQVADSSGAILPITQGQVLVSGATAGSSVDTYVKIEAELSSACTPGGVLKNNLNPGNQAGTLNFLNICAALAKGPGVLVSSINPVAYGPWSINVVALSPSGTPVGQSTYNYTIASERAATYAVALDKANYVPGSKATLTYTVSDFGGRPVADGVWPTTALTTPTGLREVYVQTNAAVIWVGSGVPVSDWDDPVSTYDGKYGYDFTVPERAMLFQMDFESFPAYNGVTGQYAWANAGGLLARSVSAAIGETPKPEITMTIVGTRTNKKMVMIDGATSGLAAGAQVVPHFRFPGQTSYTTGTGVQSVDTQGDFSWTRKTGKKIYVYFTHTKDGTEYKSNNVGIDAAS